ncbi:hypothetical protein PVAP13_8KG195101 [Panicum virgatum]|uniref:Uncharacterized protein n=1 Tax=Panicum virgatum TaxID=38727 RepID=A0A8T0PPD6_PANVG|nr:hypothetical protein PVAP13_8KG195101 [Panicum virgatum]
MALDIADCSCNQLLLGRYEAHNQVQLNTNIASVDSERLSLDMPTRALQPNAFVREDIPVARDIFTYLY